MTSAVFSLEPTLRSRTRARSITNTTTLLVASVSRNRPGAALPVRMNITAPKLAFVGWIVHGATLPARLLDG